MARICEWVGRFGDIAKGMDALANLAVWEKLFALTSPRPGDIEGRDGLPPPIPRGERPQAMAAIAGIDSERSRSPRNGFALRRAA
jgi:hypothetical protein